MFRWPPTVFATAALVSLSHARSEVWFVGNESLSEQKKVVDVSHAWRVTGGRPIH